MPSVISLTFDDGLRCHFEQALPILDQHGFRATFFVVANSDPVLDDGFPHPDWPKTDWNDEDIRLMRSMTGRGHEIGAHSLHHKQPFLDNDPRLEAEGSKRWIEDRLGTSVSSYCYPFCHCTEPIRRAVIDAGFQQARWGANRDYSPERSVPDLYKIDCRLVSVANPSTVKVDGVSHRVGRDRTEKIRGWLQPDWYVVMFHGIGTIHDGYWPVSAREFGRQMGELARLRDSGGVEIVTFAEGAQRLRGT